MLTEHHITNITIKIIQELASDNVGQSISNRVNLLFLISNFPR